MCYCDFDAPQFYNESMPKARKQHIFCECGSAIDPGEKYWRIDGMWDEFETFKMCLICRKIADLAYDDGHDCIAFGCLYETVGSEYEEEVTLWTETNSKS